MPSLKDTLRELYLSQDPKKAARSRSGAVLVKGKTETEDESANYLPLLAVMFGTAMLAMAFLKPSAGGVPRVPRMPEQNPQQESDWQQQQQNSPMQPQEW